MHWVRARWGWVTELRRRIAATILRPDAVTLAYRPAGAPDTPRPAAPETCN